jgi:hypothetical protein
MAGLSRKDKEDLALIYELPEFKALKRWNDVKRLKSMESVMKVNMQDERAETRVAFLQGQAYAHELMLLELKKIHKEVAKD